VGQPIECPVCGDKNTSFFLEVHDDRFGHPGNFAVQACPSCDHKFLSGNLPQSLSELYTRYYPRSSFDIEKFRPYKKANRLVNWLNGGLAAAFYWVPPNVRVLDIGCGMGETVAYHTARGCEAFGIDADENVLRVGARHGLNLQTGVFDASRYPANFFDYVTLDQVMEHVTDPLATLRDIGTVLKTSGICIFSTPNANSWGQKILGNKWLHWHAPYHLNFFSPKSAQLLAKAAGFRIKYMKTVTRYEWSIYQLIHLYCYPENGAESPFWSPRPHKTLWQKIAIRGLLLARFSLIPNFLTRIVDALGFGDNYVIVLEKLQADK
jgi:2-polyprenyl-3-methyl-5-hydroxy-6-metoxy-1,4-benzoquinol methylase